MLLFGQFSVPRTSCALSVSMVLVLSLVGWFWVVGWPREGDDNVLGHSANLHQLMAFAVLLSLRP